jgi:hypothetical protein
MATELTVEMVRKGKGKTSGLYLVKRGADEVGLLEKYGNTAADKHPWKAFLGVGMGSRYVGAFYPQDGGRDAALATLDRLTR